MICWCRYVPNCSRFIGTAVAIDLLLIVAFDLFPIYVKKSSITVSISFNIRKGSSAATCRPCGKDRRAAPTLSRLHWYDCGLLEMVLVRNLTSSPFSAALLPVLLTLPYFVARVIYLTPSTLLLAP